MWPMKIITFSFIYLRNPDNDSTPWCYIYRGTQIVWEFCSMPKCPEGAALQKANKVRFYQLSNSLL